VLLPVRGLQRSTANGVPIVQPSVLRPGCISAAVTPRVGAVVSKYRQLVHFIIEARDDRDASDVARKLKELLEGPVARMAIQGSGIKLAQKTGQPDGQPVVYTPKREPA
jgi:hypothetical protein